MYRESFSTYQGTSRCVLGASRHITHFELSLSVQGLLLLVNPSGSISTRPGAAAGAPGAAPGAQWSAAGERSVVSIARALAAARSSYHISRSVWNSPELIRTSRLLEIDSCSSRHRSCNSNANEQTRAIDRKWYDRKHPAKVQWISHSKQLQVNSSTVNSSTKCTQHAAG